MWSKGVSRTVSKPTVLRRTIRTYGGLKDEDRIFTNLYMDGSPYLDGALKRVSTQNFSSGHFVHVATVLTLPTGRLV